MGQKSVLPQSEVQAEDFGGLLLVDRGVQTSHRPFPGEDQPSFFSRTMTRFLKQKPQKMGKIREFSTQTDRLDLKLRARPIKGRRNMLCGCVRKNNNKWLILQNEEYFMDYEPLEELLKRTRKPPELIVEKEKNIPKKSKILENKEQIPEKESELPAFLKGGALGFSELVGFLKEKPKEINLNDIELIEPLFESDFQHIYRGFWQKRFIVIKIIELNRLEPRGIDFEEAVLRDSLKEGIIYERVKSIEDEGICQLLAQFALPRKNTTPSNERVLEIIQISEYGRCSLGELLSQREIKGYGYILSIIPSKIHREFYKERELIKILIGLCQTLFLAHQSRVAHENLGPQNLLIADSLQGFRIAGWGEAKLIRKDGVVVRKANNINNKEYLAPELYENYPEAVRNSNYDPFQADVYSLGLIVLEMMGVRSPKERELIRKGAGIDHKHLFDSLEKSYPFLTKIAAKMLEKTPESRISLRELGKLLKTNMPKEPENVQKILLATKLLDQSNETNFLRQHQRALNEGVEDLRLDKMSFKAYGYFLLGDCERSIDVYKCLLTVTIQNTGKAYFSNPKVLELLEKIGTVCYYLRDYDTALKYFEESFEGRQNKSMAVEAIAASAFNLALTYYQLEQCHYSLLYLEKSLDFYCQSELDVRLEIARILSWKGLVLSRLTRHEESLKVFQFVLKLRQEVFHVERAHYLIADTYSDIALEQVFIGNKKEAIDYYERALFMRKIVYRTAHQEIASSLNNLGSLFDDLGDWNQALNYYQDALRVLRKINPKDPEIAKIYNNIGGIYQRKRDPISSSEYFEKSLGVFEQNFDKSHPYIAKSMLGLGNNFFAKGMVDQSYECYSKGVLILNRLDCEEFLDLARLKSGLGNCYRRFKDFSLALDAYEMALGLYEEYNSFKEGEISDIYSNIANCYMEIDELNLALEFFQKCLEIRKTTLGETHLEIAWVYSNIAEVYRRKGMGVERRKFWDMGIEIKRKIYGDNNPLLEMERIKYEKEGIETEEFRGDELEMR